MNTGKSNSYQMEQSLIDTLDKLKGGKRMIDEIVEMILKEARAIDCEHPSMELYELLREINNKCWTLSRHRLEEERRKKKDESKH